jgi:hypothetical protein
MSDEISSLIFLVIGGVIGSVITYYFQSKIEEIQQIKRELRDERREIYIKILEPQIRLFSGLKNESEMKKAIKAVQSYEYRKTAFELNLFGSDDVIRANNEFMQFSFKGKETAENPNQIIILWGKLLLEIRKNLGSSKTELTEEDMLKSHITDELR